MAVACVVNMHSLELISVEKFSQNTDSISANGHAHFLMAIVESHYMNSLSAKQCRKYTLEYGCVT